MLKTSALDTFVVVVVLFVDICDVVGGNGRPARGVLRGRQRRNRVQSRRRGQQPCKVVTVQQRVRFDEGAECGVRVGALLFTDSGRRGVVYADHSGRGAVRGL
jgi:hypothetical protein